MAHQRHFPPAANSELSAIASFSDHYGTHQYRSKKTPTDVYEAFDNEFEFKHKGSTIVPLNINHQKAVTSRNISTLFLRKDVQYEFSTERPSEQGVLISTKDQATLDRLYPNHTVLDETDSSTLVTLPPDHPIYEIRKKARGYSHAVIDNKEDAAPSLLSPELRQIILENKGNIVHESNPEGADRLVIAFQNFHGSETTPWEYYIHYGKTRAKEFLAYQDSLASSIEDITSENGTSRTQYILETLPGDDKERARYIKNIKRTLKAADNSAFRRIIQGKHEWAPDAHSFSANSRAAYKGEKQKVKTYGDARVERSDSDFEKEMTYFRDKVLLKTHDFGGVGAASALNEVKSKWNNAITEQSHQELIQMTSQHLGKGQTGIMLYGAAHFHSGTSERESVTDKGLETYFRFMPNTQLVVVELPEAHPLYEAHEEMTASVKALPSEQRSKYYFLMEELEILLRALKHGAVDLNEGTRRQSLNMSALIAMTKGRDMIVDELRSIIHTPEPTPTPSPQTLKMLMPKDIKQPKPHEDHWAGYEAEDANPVLNDDEEDEDDFWAGYKKDPIT
jgi:hypothetical protein